MLTWVASRAVAAKIPGVSGYDPLTLGAVIAILIVVALAAAGVPAMRATHVDPAVSLRWE